MLTVITFAIVLSLLVFVHELGHFIAAKRTGVVVEEFAFGYPPRLLKYGQSEGKIALAGQEMVIGRKTDVSRQVEVGTRVVYESETQADGRVAVTRIQPVPGDLSDDEAAKEFGQPVNRVEQLTRGTGIWPARQLRGAIDTRHRIHHQSDSLWRLRPHAGRRRPRRCGQPGQQE